MDIKALNELAMNHADAIFAEELSRAEVVALLALIQARINVRVYSDIPSREIGATAPTSAVPEPKEKVVREVIKPPKAKPVNYDPLYDPPPPMEGDKPPERPAGTGRVLANVNDACTCSACHKVAYTVNRVIRDTDTFGVFCDSFTPLPGVPELPEKPSIINVNGRITTNCPLCNARQRLLLTGVGIADE